MAPGTLRMSKRWIGESGCREEEVCGQGLQAGKEPVALPEPKAEGRMTKNTWGSQLVSSAGTRRPLAHVV